MKKLILITAMFALVVTSAVAQLGLPSVIIDTKNGLNFSTNASQTVTNSILANTTYTNNAVIDCSRGKELALHIQFQADTSSTSNYTFTVYKSLIGGSNITNYDTTIAAMTLTIAATGATPKNIVTNLTLNGVPFVNIYKIDNTNVAGYMTNLTVRYYVK